MVPDTLLHYRILQPLGSGGMGDVYLAEDAKLGRRVALKVLPPGPATDPERRQRFEREARTIAALNHPNIVTIHAVEHDGGVTFLTMELVEGRTLSAMTPKDGMPVNELLKIAIPLADAVAAAHERGITHRDLKPANVMVTPEGRVKVLDFGLAKLNEKTIFGDASVTNLVPDLTGEGRIVGTVAYMSPEQAEGKPVDHRSDVFSLGVVLYELATGERPFSGDTNMSTLSAILKDTPRSVTDVRPDLPRDLARIVKRALVKDPEHRYQTAKDLRNDLETFKDDLASGSLDRPPTPGASTAAVARKRFRMPPLAAAAVAGVASIGAAVWYVGGGTSPESAARDDSRPFERMRLSQLTNTGRVSWSALSADGRYVAHVVFEGGKQGLWLRQVATSSNVPIVPADDVRYDGVGFSPDGNFVYYVAYPAQQNFAAVYQVPVLGGTPRKIIDDVDTPLTFSPDGQQFAFVRGSTARGETMVMVANADGTQARELAVSKNPLSFTLNNISWSPNGSTLVTIQRANQQNNGKLVAIDAKTGQQRDVGSTMWGYVDSVGWMPNGRGLIVAAQEDAPVAPTQVWYVSYPSGDVRRITNDLNSYGQVSVGADGRSVVAVQRETLTHVWVAPIDNASGGRQITRGTGQIEGMRGLAWTHDQRIVFTSSSSGHPDLWIIDASGANRRQLTADPADDFSPTVTPDGTSIVFPSNRPGASVWQMNLDGSNLRPLVTAPMSRWPLITKDMKWVYYTSFAEPQRSLWRMPMAGGTPERLTRRWDAMGVTQDGVFFHPTMLLNALMPDGVRAVGYYSDPAFRGSRAVIVPLEGDGVPTPLDMRFTVIPTPDGRHLIHVDIRDGVPMLVRRPLAGGPAVVLGTFPGEGSLNLALSPDGRQLALSRGTTTSDVVLINDQKQ